MDIKHILSLPEKELREWLLAKIVPKPWKHKWMNWGKAETSYWQCLKCEKKVNRLTKENEEDPPCPIPDSIALDWNLAMKKRDEIVTSGEVGAAGKFVDYLWEVFVESERGNTRANNLIWIASSAQPHHYILAALIAKESQDEGAGK